jgi:hypothetical protein
MMIRMHYLHHSTVTKPSCQVVMYKLVIYCINTWPGGVLQQTVGTRIVDSMGCSKHGQHPMDTSIIDGLSYDSYWQYSCVLLVRLFLLTSLHWHCWYHTFSLGLAMQTAESAIHMPCGRMGNSAGMVISTQNLQFL